MASAQIQRGFTLMSGIIILVALIGFPIALAVGGGGWSFAFLFAAAFWGVIYIVSKRRGARIRARIARGQLDQRPDRD